MKVVLGAMMIGVCSVAALAQGETRAVAQPKVIAELAAAAAAVKGQPFSAEAVSESVQTLQDGNRIVQSSTSKIYRNSDGKVRREMTGGSGGMTFFNTFETGVSIAEPSGNRILIDPSEKTARTFTVISPEAVKVRGSELTDEQRKAVEKMQTFKVTVDGAPGNEEKRAVEVVRGTAVMSGTPATAAIAPMAPLPPMAGGFGGGFVYSTGDHQRWETKSEDLGTQNIEGLTCEGTRRTTTIPAGAIGNDRPIEMVYERWYSKDLQMVVSSKHSDPRFGEQTYTLKNINRSEPDPSLFTVPQGFKVISDGHGDGMYVRTPKPAAAPAPVIAPKQP
jgi:hypothetical protein